MKIVLLNACISLQLAACATEPPTPSAPKVPYHIFSVSAPVIAILASDLFVGEAVGYLDHTGKIDIQSVLDPDLKCVGAFKYTGTKTGTAYVQCNDGNEAALSFNGLGTLSGYGYGKTTRGPASFTFGLTPIEASQYLTLPKGKKITVQPQGPRLSDV